MTPAPEPPDSSAPDPEWSFGGWAESVAASYEAARKAIVLVRAYRRELGTTGRRERECLEEVARLRRSIAALRARSQAGEIPGLRKVDASEPPAAATQASKRSA